MYIEMFVEREIKHEMPIDLLLLFSNELTNEDIFF